MSTDTLALLSKINLDGDPTLLAHAKQYLKKNLYLLSRLKQYVDTSTQKLFHDAHTSPQLTYASTFWDGYSDILFHKLNFLYRRAAQLMMPDLSLATDAKPQHLGLLPFREKLMLNKAVLVFESIPKSGTPVFQRPFYLSQQLCPIAIYDTAKTQNRPV